MATSRPSISPSLLYEAMEETLDIKTPGAKLHIGIPKEIAFQENRIALTPDAVGVLVANGNMVTIEHLAGERSHYSDKDYAEAGAQIVYDRSAVYQCPILVKSAPPVEEDMRHNTDLIVLRLDAVRIGCRVRRYQYVHSFGGEFTIRPGARGGA